jgi:hypothetical protein
MASSGWESSFVAVSVALGLPAEEACAALEGDARERARLFAKTLEGSTQKSRARALATGLAPVALAIEKARLA